MHTAEQSASARGESEPLPAAAGAGAANGLAGSATAGTGPSSAVGLPGPSSTPLAQPAGCAQPNIPAATLEAVVPETPPLAAQQNISGLVTVIVSLDAASHVIGARVLTSPSALLDAAALQAARASTFRTEVRDCRPVAAAYAFIVEFTSQ